MDPSQQPPDQPNDPKIFNGPFKNPLGANSPPSAPVFTSPPPNSQPEPEEESETRSNKPLFVLYVAAAIELLVIVVLAVVVLGAHKNTPAATTNSSTNNAQTQGPQPATSIGVQQSSDSISQDIGNLNDDHDLPTDKLSDQALGL